MPLEAPSPVTPRITNTRYATSKSTLPTQLLATLGPDIRFGASKSAGEPKPPSLSDRLKNWLKQALTQLFSPFQWLWNLITGNKPTQKANKTTNKASSKPPQPKPLSTQARLEHRLKQLKNELYIRKHLHAIAEKKLSPPTLTVTNLQWRFRTHQDFIEDVIKTSNPTYCIPKLPLSNSEIKALHRGLQAKSKTNRIQATKLLEMLSKIPGFPEQYSKTLSTPTKTIAIDFAKQAEIMVKDIEEAPTVPEKVSAILRLQELAKASTPHLNTLLRNIHEEYFKNEHPQIKAAALLGFLRFPDIRTQDYFRMLLTAIYSKNNLFATLGVFGATMDDNTLFVSKKPLDPEEKAKLWQVNLALEQLHNRLKTEVATNPNTSSVSLESSIKDILDKRELFDYYRHIDPADISKRLSEGWAVDETLRYDGMHMSENLEEVLQSTILSYKAMQQYPPGEKSNPGHKLRAVTQGGSDIKPLAQKLADEVMGPNSLITLDLRELKTREVLEDKLLSAAVPTPTVSDKPSFANKVILIDHLEELEKLTDKKAQARILGFLSYLVHQDLSKGMDLSDTILFFNSNQPLKQLACMKTVEGDQFTNRLSGCNGLSLTYPSSKP